MHHSSDFFHIFRLQTLLPHQFVITGIDIFSVQYRTDTMPRKFFHTAYPRSVDSLPPRQISFLQGTGNRMVGIAFRIRCLFQQFLFLDPLRRNQLVHGKSPLGERSRFIHHYHFRIRKSLQIIASFNQYPGFSGTSQTSEEAKRNTDYQCTGTGNHKETQCPVYPYLPAAPCRQRRDNCQKHGTAYYDGRIISGKLGNEMFRLRLLAAGIFHQIQYFGHR